MAVLVSPLYTGTRIFLPISQSIGLPLDQTNFVIVQLSAIVFGVILRLCFPQVDSLTSQEQTQRRTTCRYMYCLLTGVAMMWALIGWQSTLVYIQIVACYFLMRILPPTQQQLPVFVLALGYMLALYMYRITQVFDHLCYDASYPLMITTQKLTTLAFSISDWRSLQGQGQCHGQGQGHSQGLTPDDQSHHQIYNNGGHANQYSAIQSNGNSQLGDTSSVKEDDDNCSSSSRIAPERVKWAVREVPSFLEFLSFSLSYQGVLAGPFCHFRMYKAFIEGRHRDRRMEDNNIPVECLDDGRSCATTVIKKLATVFVWVTLCLVFKPHFPDETNVDPVFISKYNMLTRIGYLYVSLFLHRTKYYVTWGLAEIVHNASGMGYLGQDKDGRHDWSGMCNVKVWKIETATSLKVYLDNWNIMTSQWLRHVCYTRSPVQPTLLTFLLSALWHGLFLGYYLTFVCAAVFVEAGRKIRYNIRPMFQTSTHLQVVYGVMTLVGTQLSLAFLVLSFVILQWEPCVRFHSSFYWVPHITCFLLLLILPSKPGRKPPLHQSQNNNVHEDNQAARNQKPNIVHRGLNSHSIRSRKHNS